MKKIIIGVHGLGNKPPRLLLEKWWKKSIEEGFRKCRIPLKTIPFKLVYWADIIHPQPQKQWVTDADDPLFLDEPYRKGKKESGPHQSSMRKRIYKYLEEQLDKIFLNDDMTLNFSSVTDKIIHRYFTDLEIYFSGTVSARNDICQRLIAQLKKYKDHDIMLIGHSMGSIIAYDVLSKLANDLNIRIFVTIGSPLGLPIITSRIFNENREQHKQSGLITPDSILEKWYNLSDQEDHVALDHSLADDYSQNLRGIRAEDILVVNDYENEGKRNPHKAYGYLRTPELIRIIDEFLQDAEISVVSRMYQAVRNLFRSAAGKIRKTNQK